MAEWLIVKPIFVKNENFSRYIIITYNEFQLTIKVENSGLFYWDHNEGELLQKKILLSANRAEVGYIFHVSNSIQIANWNAMFMFCMS